MVVMKVDLGTPWEIMKTMGMLPHRFPAFFVVRVFKWGSCRNGNFLLANCAYAAGDV